MSNAKVKYTVKKRHQCTLALGEVQTNRSAYFLVNPSRNVLI